MAWINFNCFSRHLSGFFSQIDNFKSLEQNSDKWGIRDLFESLIFVVNITAGTQEMKIHFIAYHDGAGDVDYFCQRLIQVSENLCQSLNSI